MPRAGSGTTDGAHEIGARRFRVWIQQQMADEEGEPDSVDRDASGAVITRWRNVGRRFTTFQPHGRVPGGEAYFGEQVSAEVTLLMIMRGWYHPKTGERLTPKYRLKMGSRIFNIETIVNPGELGGSTPIHVWVKEQVANGTESS